MSLLASAQTELKGTIRDSLSRKPIPFAGVGIAGKPMGTLSDEQGKYNFIVKAAVNDSVKVSAIGYKTVGFKLSEFGQERDLYLVPSATQLEEVEVKSSKIKYAVLGNSKYTKNNCSGFVKNESNWKGSEAAILAGNKEGRSVRIESFSFFIIQNKYSDSLTFRLMFYEASDKKYPRLKTFLRKPVIFKIAVKQGEFTLDLKNYNIVTDKDFFISLECLMDEMDISKFCYAGSYGTASYVKASAFDRWHRIRGGGGDFNVKVSFVK